MRPDEIYNEVRRANGISLPETIKELLSSEIEVSLKIALNDTLAYETYIRLRVQGFAAFNSFSLQNPHFINIGVTPFPFLDCDILGIQIRLGTSVGVTYQELIQTPFRNRRYHFGICSITQAK